MMSLRTFARSLLVMTVVLGSVSAVYAGKKDKDGDSEVKYPQKVEFAGTVSVEKDEKEKATGAAFTTDKGEQYPLEFDSKAKKLAKKYEGKKVTLKGTLFEKRIRVKTNKKTKFENVVHLKVDKYEEVKEDAPEAAAEEEAQPAAE